MLEPRQTGNEHSEFCDFNLSHGSEPCDCGTDPYKHSMPSKPDIRRIDGPLESPHYYFSRAYHESRYTIGSRSPSDEHICREMLEQMSQGLIQLTEFLNEKFQKKDYE